MRKGDGKEPKSSARRARPAEWGCSQREKMGRRGENTADLGGERLREHISQACSEGLAMVISLPASDL